VGRQLNFVAAGIAFSIFTAHISLAQGPPGGQGPPGQNHQLQRPPNMRERWMQLPPEERQIFERNAERWLHMTPQQQNILRQREKLRRARLKNEADTLLRQSGLQLDQKRRDLFESRYMQERSKMERHLRQEFEAKRKQQLPALSERLKNEFQSPKSPAQRPSSAPAVSVSPRH
jgi:hypothetical protein